MTLRPQTRDPERGSALVMVATGILVLTAFLTFVVDYGILWVSRGEAQNAADAGALAGALARAFDDFADPPVVTGPAAQSAKRAAEANNVWGAVPAVQITFGCPLGVTGSCIRTDVYRNGEFGSAPLPTVFGPVLNIFDQGVRATATAVVATGNATDCMRPFSVMDKWTHVINPLDEYNRWTKVGGAPVELNPHDTYVPPDSSGPGTGYRVPDDVGDEQILKGGNNPNSSATTLQSGWFLPVRLPDGEGGYISGADDYREAIGTCIGNRVTIGEYLPTESGAMVGPTNQGVQDLIDQDSAATFNTSTGLVENSCAPSCAPISPRVVPISVFDIDDFQRRQASGDWTVCPTGGKCIKVVNILGYFVSHMSGQDIVGYLMTMPGFFVVGPPAPGGGGGFLQVIQLVR